MDLIIHRTTNDRLMNDTDKNSVDIFIVKPENLAHEFVGFNVQEFVYDKANDSMLIYLIDSSSEKDYLA